MKIAASLVLISALSAQAFVPIHQPAAATSLAAKGAKSAEEDLELTRKVIAQYFGDEMGGASEPAPAPAAEPAKKKSKKAKKAKKED